MGISGDLFRMTSNELYQLTPEPSLQEEFEHIVTNFILDQEERVKQLEGYMKVIVGDFMQLSSEVTRRLKEKMREDGSRMRKIKKITKYPDIEVSKPLAWHKFSENSTKKGNHLQSTMRKRAKSTREQYSTSQEVSLEEKVWRFRVFKNGVHQMHHDSLARRPIHSGDVIDWEFLASQGLDQAFFESINKDPFFGPQWVNLF
ncbi:hypothetical protein Tco_0536697 [Tanacetum coccineum]